MSEKKTYTLAYKCDNCEYCGPMKIPFGTKAPTTMACENCGCETAKRHRESMNPWEYGKWPWTTRKPYDPLRDVPQMSKNTGAIGPSDYVRDGKVVKVLN